MLDDVTVNLTQSNSGDLGAGYSGEGSITIEDGVTVCSKNGNLGYNTGSSGIATVDGKGSTWANRYSLYVGYNGTGSSLRVGTEETDWAGTLTNNGTINIVASTSVAAGTYDPLSYGTMSGSGIVLALGGVWDSSIQTFTVSETAEDNGDGGATISFDLSSGQRVLITDSNTGLSTGVAFLATDTSIMISLTGTTVSSDELASLESLLTDADEEVLSAWNYATQGYTVSADTPVYLSLYVESAEGLVNLTIWHLVNGEWTKYTTFDFSIDRNYVSFVAESFSSYAVTGASSVPIPSALLSMNSGLIALIAGARRKV